MPAQGVALGDLANPFDRIPSSGGRVRERYVGPDGSNVGVTWIELLRNPLTCGASVGTGAVIG
jgi:hypothetical protein